MSIPSGAGASGLRPAHPHRLCPAEAFVEIVEGEVTLLFRQLDQLRMRVCTSVPALGGTFLGVGISSAV